MADSHALVVDYETVRAAARAAGKRITIDAWTRDTATRDAILSVWGVV